MHSNLLSIILKYSGYFLPVGFERGESSYGTVFRRACIATPISGK